MTTQIERAACTLLNMHRGDLYDPEIAEWVSAIVSNPDHAEFSQSSKHTNNFKWQYNGPDFDALEKQIGAPKAAYARFAHDAIINLGNAIVGYRSENRPAGDTMTNLEGVAVIITSLAAQVVEFHQAIIDAWAIQVDEMLNA